MGFFKDLFSSERIKGEDALRSYELGDEFMVKNKLDDAILRFKYAIYINPYQYNFLNFASYNALGEAYKRKGDYESALLNYKKAIDISSSAACKVNPEYVAIVEKAIENLEKLIK